MKEALIYMRDREAGRLREDEYGFHFTYSEKYLADPEALPVSCTLPLRAEAYEHPVLFPFFDGLIPEGWLLNLAHRNWKIDPRDRMSLLMLCCEDCIGAVSVKDPNREI